MVQHVKNYSINDKTKLLETNYHVSLDYYVNNSDNNFTSNESCQAITLLNKAIAINPTNGHYILIRGIYLANIGKTNDAFKDFERALEISPNYTDAYLKRASIHLENNNINAAFSNIAFALKLEQDYYITYIYAGLAFLKTDAFGKALKCFNVAIKKNPTYPFSYLYRGIVYESLNMTNMAINDYEHFLTYRSDLEVMNTLAWLYLTDRNFKNVNRGFAFAEIIVNSSRKPMYLDTLACAYAEKGNFNKATELEKEAYNISNNEYYNNMMEIFNNKFTYLQWKEKHPNTLLKLELNNNSN